MARVKNGLPRNRPLAFKSAEELEEKIAEFFRIRSESKLPCTLEGLAVHLNITRYTLTNYAKNDIFADVIERTKARIADNMMANGLAGNYNATLAIFIAKNHHGYDSDKPKEKDNSVMSDYLMSILTPEQLIALKKKQEESQ